MSCLPLDATVSHRRALPARGLASGLQRQRDAGHRRHGGNPFADLAQRQQDGVRRGRTDRLVGWRGRMAGAARLGHLTACEQTLASADRARRAMYIDSLSEGQQLNALLLSLGPGVGEWLK